MASIVEFGDALLRTGDLDPVYVAIAGRKNPIDAPTKARLCLAYWCFYHLGAAAKLAEISQPRAFWKAMMQAAANPPLKDGSRAWPRGSERRHYRGQQAVASMTELVGKYGKLGVPGAAVFEMMGLPLGVTKSTYSQVARSVMSHRGFGQWIAFKIADMGERVLGLDIDFSDCHLGIYKDPRQGAAVAAIEWQEEAGAILPGVDFPAHAPWEYPISDDELAVTVAHYVNLWRKKRAKALPSKDRLVNVQEIETIFCKYKSHLKGHYPVGKDTIEVYHGLEGWGDLANQLRSNMEEIRNNFA